MFTKFTFSSKAKEKLFKIVKRTVEHRKKNPPKKGEHLLIDLLIGQICIKRSPLAI
jgi:hypothetical protein